MLTDIVVRFLIEPHRHDRSRVAYIVARAVAPPCDVARPVDWGEVAQLKGDCSSNTSETTHPERSSAHPARRKNRPPLDWWCGALIPGRARGGKAPPFSQWRGGGLERVEDKHLEHV